MKNDEYTFLDDPKDSNFPALKELTTRCNHLLAKLLVTDRLKKLQGKNLWQGHPMLAVYPGSGAAYGRHLDSTGGQRSNGRVLTLVLYLNPFWQPAHGGSLRLLEQLADETGTEVEPLHGRLVGFLCEDQNPHETRCSGWSLGGQWFEHVSQVFANASCCEAIMPFMKHATVNMSHK